MGLIRGLAKGSKFSIKLCGIVAAAVGLLMVLFCVFILVFGQKTDAYYTGITPAKQKYTVHYTYNAEGKDHEYTKRVSKGTVVSADSITVRYLKFAPSVTYNGTMLVLGLIITFIGGLCVYACKKE